MMNRQPNPVRDTEMSNGVAALLATMQMIVVVFRIIVVLLLVIYLISGVFYVNSDEKSFIVRFGAIMEKGRSETCL